MELRDSVVPGLILRVSKTGVKSWCVWGRPKTGYAKPVRVGLGRYPKVTLAKARQRAREVINELERGRVPTEHMTRARTWSLPRATQSVELMGRAFLKDIEDSALSQWTKAAYAQHFEGSVVPAFGLQRPDAVTRTDVRRWMESLAKEKPFAANRGFEVLRRIYRWAAENDLTTHNPCSGLKAPHRERPRERVLSLEEARKVWAAASALGRQGRPVLLLMLTAARLREVLGMRWAELELEGDDPKWTLSGDRRKGGEPLVLPLVGAAVEILVEHKKAKKRVPREIFGCEWVFPNPGLDGPQRWSQRGPTKVREDSGVSDWQIRDLRRTTASHLAAAGTPIDIVEAILGHRRPVLVRTYQRFAPLGPMREALEAWARRLVGPSGC